MALNRHNDKTFSGKRWELINNKIVCYTPRVVHSFRIYQNYDDPDMIAADPLWHWEQSEMGKWVMKNSVIPPEWQRLMYHDNMAYQYNVIAYFKEQDLVFWTLKFR
jgi:hypothetical protein